MPLPFKATTVAAAAGVLFYLVLANADAILKAISLKHHIG
jgi:hypothetical protein